MNITRFSIKRPIGICMIYILVCVLGLISFFRIGVELLPDVDSKFISVIVNYPGASTESVEQQVTKPIEDELSSISHFKQVRSATRPGRAEIFVELDSQADADMVAIEATKKVSRIRKNLPEDIDEPAVLKRSSEEYPIIQIAATSKDNLDDIFALADSSFKERLQQAAGVADVDVTGGRTKEVAIEVDKDKLNYYGLTLQDIITAVRKENVIVSSGSVYTDALEKTVRLQAQYKAPEEIQHLQLKGAGGRYIELGQVANVQAKDKRAVAYSRVDGNEAVSLEVYKASGANIVDTADGVLQQLETLRKDYPDYVFTVVYDQSHFVRDSLSNTLKTLLEGLVTTGLVLYLFLRGWKSSMAVMIAIPTSLIATFFLMYLAGFTFNMMSLMGMALCIGILVDDSIVVLENIHRFLAMGKSADVAAEEGRNEIGMAAIAMTLCDVVVFLPIAFMQSATGQFFKQFGMTIVFATLMSLVVSFTLTPMLASRFYKNGVEEPKGKLWSRLDDFEAQTIAKYDVLLRKCIEKPKKLVLGVLAAFAVAVALVPLGIVGSEYMPRTDESAIQVNIELPTGFNADQTNEALLLFEDYLAKVPEIEHYMTNVTTTQSMGKLVIALKSSKDGFIDEVDYFNEDVKNTGVELSYAIKHDDNWSTRWGATYQNPKAQNIHNYGDMDWHQIYNKYQLQGAVDYTQSKFAASMSVNFVGDRMSTRASITKPQREIKPQCFTDLHFTYAPEKNQKAFLHINNIFDRLDITSNSTSNFYSLGRNFMVGYEYSF